jgi:hypothetical protein
MHALLIHKAPIEGGTRFIFSARSMTCYNGLNTQNAFSIVWSDLSLVVDLSADLLANPNGVPAEDFIAGINTSSNNVLRDSTVGAELIGLGYLSDVSFSSIESSSNFETVLASLRQTIHDYCPSNLSGVKSYVGALVNRETFFGSYYDEDAGLVASLRKRTDNEKLIAKVLTRICTSPDRGMSYRHFSQASKDRLAGLLPRSGILRAFCTYEDYSGMTFALVGSERPSGLAVAYLQAWRNTVQGWKSKVAAHSFLVQLQRITPRGNSVLPVLSAIFQGSDDSDIISYTCPTFQRAVYKHTIFQLGHLFRDSRPMIQEGRYNKGGQSSVIESNTLRLLPTAGARPGVNLLDLALQFRHISDMIQHFSPSNLAAYRYDATALTNAWTSRGRTMTGPDVLWTTFKTEAMGQGSLLAPEVPQVATDGAAQGFVAWVSTNAAETVH